MPIWFLMLALAMPLSGVQAAALYAQSPSNSGVGVDSSMTVPDGSDADIIAYDYFTATASGTVTNISWQGSSIGNLEFTVLIQSDVATPDSPIPQRVTVAQYTVPAGAANPAPTSVTGWYNFSYTLPTSFDLTSGQFYAISIEIGRAHV